MKITSNLLLNYSAPDDLIEYFDQNYPDGEEIVTIFQNESKLQLLHFIIKFFHVSNEVRALYNQKCNIQGGIHIYNSKNINNSHYIVNSQNIQNSEMIQNSFDIYGSKFIYYSSHVKGSTDVWESRDVTTSQRIILSDDVVDSDNVLSSRHISWSSVINNCNNVDSSKAIYKSNNMLDSYFCGFCNNLSNSMFCVNHYDKNYQIFNKDVDILTFQRIYDQLLFKLQLEDFNFIKVNASGYRAEDRYKTSVRFDYMFDCLSADFYGWISTLPNYSEDLFMSLFFKQLRSDK